MVEVSASADLSPMMWGKSAYSYPGKFLGSGNRCGHDPARFSAERLALPETKSGHRLSILQKLIDRVQGYFLDPASIPLLAYREDKKKHDGSYRQNRSEAREAHGLVASTIIADLDLKSLRVGNYAPNGEFRCTSFDELARRCGLTKPAAIATDKPVANSRFWRCVAQLKRAGMFEVFEQYEETPDGKRGRPAIKVVSEKFLRVLGGITKDAMGAARKKATKAVAKFIAGAVVGGIQSKDEQDELSAQVRSQRTRKTLFPKPVIKNLSPGVSSPVGVLEPDNSLLLESWKAHSEQVYAAMAEALGRRPTLAESRTRYAEFGGLTTEEWSARRRRL